MPRQEHESIKVKRKSWFFGGTFWADIISNCVEAFSGKIDPDLLVHKKKNTIKAVLVLLFSGIVPLIFVLIPKTLIVFGASAINFKEINFMQSCRAKIPFLLFAFFTSGIFLLLYHKYVSVMHPWIVGKIKWLVAIAVFLCVAFCYLIVFFEPLKTFLFCLFLCYVLAFLFSIFLGSFVNKAWIEFAKKEIDITIVRDVIGWWYCINFVTAIFLFALWFFFPIEKFNMSTEASVITLKFVWLIILLIISNLIVGGIRSPIFNKRDVYFEQIKALNSNIQSQDIVRTSQDDTKQSGDNKIAGMMSVLFGLIQTSRFVWALFSAVLVYMLVGSLEYSFLAMLFLMFSFVFNDVIDFKDDKVGHPDRPLPMGVITIKLGMFFCGIIIISGFLFCHYFKQDTLFFSTIFLLSALYSLVLKKFFPSFATLLWCIIVTILVLFPLQCGVWEHVLLLSFFYAREILLDYKDKESDRICCFTRSVPCILGKNTFCLSTVCLFVSILSSVKLGNPYLTLLCSTMFSFSAILTILLFKYKTNSRIFTDLYVANVLSLTMLLSFPFIILL